MQWRLWLHLLLLVSLWLPLPGVARAQGSGTEPTGFLLKAVQTPPQICPGSQLIYTLTLVETSAPTVAAYRTTIIDSLPAQTAYLGHTGDGATYNASNNTLTWFVSVDPAQPALEPPTLVYTLTVNSGVADGTLLTNSATGSLGGVTPVGATTSHQVQCNPATEPLRDPADYPTLDAEATPPTDTVEDAQLLLDPTTIISESAASLLETPELGDELPPGYSNNTLYLPLIQTAGTASTAADVVTTANLATPGGDLPIAGAPTCDYVYPWVSRHGMSEAVYQADALKWANANYRPIAVSANGVGNDKRFASLWIKDHKYGQNWSLKHALTGTEYQQFFEQFGAAGFVPIVIDLYGNVSDPRYAAIWVKENKLTRSKHGIDSTAMQAEIDQAQADGLRPVWVSGLGDPSHDKPIFAGIWTKDAYTGTMRIGLTDKDIGTKGIARDMVNRGYRMAQLSGYETKDGIRYAAVWTKGGSCPDARWEAFRGQTSTQYQIKASAQRTVSSVKPVAGGVITIKPSELGGAFRIGRVSLRHNLGNGQSAALTRIQGEVANQFQHGDILVLQAEPGFSITAQEVGNGNLKLRPWVVTAPVGQPFVLDNYQFRLVLQYDNNLQKWVELQRNNLSPDYYWPTSIDEYGPANQRRYNSVWQAGPVDRTWRVTGVPNGADPLATFDLAMQAYMQRRNVPGGALAISVNGQIVLSRGYSWEPAAVSATPADARFRLASVSKPMTAIGILKLVEQGKLNLDAKLKDIPGFDAVLQSNNWTDPQIKEVTVRQLLHHLGGWDRDQTTDPMINDWAVCQFANPDALPTTKTSILNYSRSLAFDYKPGYAHAYSNYGYMLLGLLMETVSGQSYSTYMKNTVFAPVNANGFSLGDNLGTSAKEVRYYKPNNAMEASRLGVSGAVPPGFQVCNSAHAALTHTSYGGLNVEPMAAHGGWIASAADLVKVMDGLDSATLLTADSRGKLWSRPDGRAKRVGALDGATVKYTDYTLHARKSQPGMTFTPMDDKNDLLFLGRGLNKFGSIEFKFSQPGAGYTLSVIYPKKGGGWRTLTADDDVLVDGTDGFKKDGKLTFTAPADWAPVVLNVFDTQPKFYVIVYSQSKPTTVAQIDTAEPDGETGYALGWNAAEATARLVYTNRFGTIAVNNTIIGEQSKAIARVIAIPDPTSSSGVLTIDKLVGGPFRKGEKLLIGNQVVAQTVDREYAVTASASHGGLLWGTVTSIKHRTDGVNWALLFNQDNTYDPYWYLPSDTAITSAIDTLANEFTNEGKWPAVAASE